MKKDIQDLIKAGTDSLASREWGEALEYFKEARTRILRQLETNHGDEAVLMEWLSVLDGDDARHGRIAMARDYRDRISGLREWMTQSRITKGMPAIKRKEAFQKARHELALNSLMPAMQEAANAAIQSIGESEGSSQAEYFKISEAVFAYIFANFMTIDPDNEEGIIEFCLEIENDPSFEAEKRASRSRNPLAVEERMTSHYQSILKKDFTQSLFRIHKNTFEELSRQILSALDISNRDKFWHDIARWAETSGVMPPDLEN